MEEKRKRTYVSPEAVPVVFQVKDIVVASGGGTEDVDMLSSFSNKVENFLDGIGN